MTRRTPGPPVGASRHHPSVVRLTERAAADAQIRLAEAITRFAGSMAFVYLHVAAFAIWMLAVERSPWPTLTLVVSLEAIFLSTFVMIGQNRQADFQRHKADHDFVAQELALQHNTELTALVHDLTVQIHRVVCSPEGEPAALSVPTPPATGRRPSEG